MFMNGATRINEINGVQFILSIIYPVLHRLPCVRDSVAYVSMAKVMRGKRRFASTVMV